MSQKRIAIKLANESLNLSYTTKPIGVGTGLGLSVSYSIITENHVGKMTDESELNAGTKFIISLPMSNMSQ